MWLLFQEVGLHSHAECIIRVIVMKFPWVRFKEWVDVSSVCQTRGVLREALDTLNVKSNGSRKFADDIEP